MHLKHIKRVVILGIIRIPENQIEFERMPTTEKQCLGYLKKPIFIEGYLCRKCQHNEYRLNNRGIMTCKNCRDKLSITSNTIFHKSKLPLVTIFRALWWMVAQKNGVSAIGLRVLSLGNCRTAWAWLHKFRRLIVFSGRDRLSEKVEVDQTLFGRKKVGKRGRVAEGKSLVIIAIEMFEKGTGRIRMPLILNANRRRPNSRGLLFQRLINQGSFHKPIEYKLINSM